MSKETNSLWVGPTALFVGICLFFFGGLGTHYLATLSTSSWIGLAGNLTIVMGVVLIFLGVDQIRKDANDK